MAPCTTFLMATVSMLPLARVGQFYFLRALQRVRVLRLLRKRQARLRKLGTLATPPRHTKMARGGLFGAQELM